MMKIEIGCTRDLCERKDFAEVCTDACFELALGFFIPDGWTIFIGKDKGGGAPRLVSFFCPDHPEGE